MLKKEIAMPLHDSSGETYFSAKEAIQYLNVSSSHFYYLVNTGKITRHHQRVQARSLYKKSQLKALKDISELA
jgi:hypothetical protein